MFDVAWGGSAFVAEALWGTIARSIDGVTWPEVTSSRKATRQYPNAVTWDGSHLVAVGNNETIVVSL